MSTTLDRDIEIVQNALSDWSDIEITHKHNDTRQVDDFVGALGDVLYSIEDKEEYMEQYKEEIKDHQAEKNEMLKHIKRLEKMLHKREVKFKDWEAVSRDMYF